MTLSTDVAVGDALPPILNGTRAAVNELEEELAETIRKPSGAQTGDMMLYDGTKWVSSETRFFEGNGNPNGVVAAPIGSRYVDKTAAQGSVEWVKSADGDSNTGWFSSFGALALKGQTGTFQVSGPAAVMKTRAFDLSADIFKGATPRQVLVSPVGSGGDFTHTTVISKGPNKFTVGCRHLDKVAYAAAQVLTVDYIAIL